MDTPPLKKKTLLLKYAGSFNDTFEWCVLERVYYACNLQPNRKWTCRFSYIEKNTSVKNHKSISAALDRLYKKHLVDRKEYAKPTEKNPKQRYQYTASQANIDKLLVANATRTWGEMPPEPGGK